MNTKRENLIKEQIEAAWKVRWRYPNADCVITSGNEGGHVAIPGGSETPEFDECLKEALEPYHEEYMEVTA